MNWLGKSYAKLLRNLPPKTLLCEDKAHNAKPENANSQNLLIQGDNLEVLKHLKNAYKGRVKMIYIDPPYNTGSDGFVYQDDRKFTPEQLSELAHINLDEAERILKFTAKGANSHSAWLTFMYPRLYIARDLLKEDGVIFISIDDNEVAQLKLLCDEVFGEGNFVEKIIWKKRSGPPNDKKIAAVHEYILIYTKNAQVLSLNLKERNEKQLSRYKNPDNHPKGKWAADNLMANVKGGRFVQSLYFPIRNPITGEEHYPSSNGNWRFNQKKMMNLLENNEIYFGEDGKGRPKLKRFLCDVKNGVTYSTLWDFVPFNNVASAEISNLLGNLNIFDTPKPVDLIKELLALGTNTNDVIIDFFAGSGTTAHSVMQFNAKDGGNRQFILVQLPEKTDEKSEAFKAGYKTIFDITKARIEKSAVKIRQDFPDTQCDLGFKIYQTTDNFRDHSDDEFSLEQATLPFVENLTEAQYHSLLTTWALNDGALLTDPISEVKLGDYTAHLCDKRLYLLETGFTSADLLVFIQKLDSDKDFNPNRVIVFGENMSSAMQQELNQAIETYSNKKNIVLSLIIRN
ncbi:type III restriction endonuclease subunit M [Rodentibacter mrazii]|uniref:site-specific DNA-methyltransferase (adenine-specific) n=2 Tax=Rodentibacter mrazii TaxID=1908257 RepID=A0A1V3IDM9_9PAST|nr:type III restriction endonuclease subunit M [Rodentibacter mrazii]